MSPGSQGLPGLMDIPSGAQRRLCKQRAYAMLRKGFQPREAGIFRSREPEPQLRRSSPSRRSRSCLLHFFVLYPPGFFEMKRKLIYVKNGLCRCRSIGKRNFPKMFFFQMCRLDPGFQIRHGLIWNDSRTVWSAVNACGFRKPNREAANSLS